MTEPWRPVAGTKTSLQTPAALTQQIRWHLVIAERDAPIVHPSYTWTPDAAWCTGLVSAWQMYTHGGNYELPVYLDHDDDDLRIGHVQALEYRDGRGVYAQIRWLPETWDLVQSERLTHLSPGILHNAVDDRGQRYDALLLEVSAVTAPHLVELPPIVEGQETLNTQKETMTMAEDVQQQTDEQPTVEQRLTALEQQFATLLETLQPKNEEDDEQEDDAEKVELRQQLEAYKEREATAAVDALVQARRLQPGAQQVWVQLYRTNPELFADCASSLAPSILDGTVGFRGAQASPTVEKHEKPAAATELMRRHMRGGKTAKEAYELAWRELGD